jgi:hypothetical protein
MLDFSGFDNTSGSFPNVEATDSSGPTLRDGTPINADLINDIWGGFQAILSAAGTTPSDDVETSTSSDLLDSIRRLCGVAGEIVFHASPSDAISANILPLKGQVITISAYPALVDATYIGNTNNPSGFYTAFFKCSDAGGTTRDTAGPYFKLPDCRGYFVRALAGAATGVDAYRDYYTTFIGKDYRNMAGSLTGYSPGQHVHDVETAGGDGVAEDLQYVMRANPGSITGSAATVSTYPAYMYKKQAGAYEDLVTQIGRLIPPVLIDFGDNASYNEVYPVNAGFQLGIRY